MRSTAVWAAILGPVGVSAVLNTLAKEAGLKYFGSCLTEGELNVDANYTAIISDTTEFGGLTPENGMKWDATEATQGVFTYTEGDITANQAKKTGQVLRCHTQIWYSQLPSWVSSGSWTTTTLQAVMESHMTNVMGHYKGDCYAWDVVNEAIADDGTWRSDVWLSTFNTSYVPLAFNIAKQADPNVKLYYNDYNLEYNGAKTDTAVQLVQLVQAAGAPIDGVGFQGHMIVGSTPGRSSLATAMERFTALGLEVAYTELDIRHSSLPPSSAALVQQGNDYANMVGSCLDVAGCVGVTVWGVTDKYSWVPQTFSGAGDALLYDDSYNRKVAWTSVSSVLAAKATSPPASSSTPATSSTTLATVTTTPISTKPSSTSTTTAAHSTTSSAAGAQQTHWGQCGGNGWSGPTSCQSPYTCQKQNDWYSQCL